MKDTKQLELILKNIKYSLDQEWKSIEKFKKTNNLVGIDDVLDQLILDLACDQVDIKELIKNNYKPKKSTINNCIIALIKLFENWLDEIKTWKKPENFEHINYRDILLELALIIKNLENQKEKIKKLHESEKNKNASVGMK